jgi:SulP family sulfate permease
MGQLAPRPFRFTISELSGAVADLGVMLPLLLALVTLNGVDAVSAFTVVGAAYLIAALTYRLPIPVQPLKSLAATALALKLGAPVITAGAYWVAAVFLLFALTGADRWVGRLFPTPIVRGIQVGLGLLLVRSSASLVRSDWTVALLAAAVLAIALWSRPGIAALLVILVGLAEGLLSHGWPGGGFSVQLPAWTGFPPRAAFGPGFWLLALPQIPLSLANSVYATRDAAAQYFGDEARERVTATRLLGTMSVMNVMAAVFGGVPLCHGCGGLTAHYRLGARTGGAPLMIGALFLAMGLAGGAALVPLARLIPYAVLGVLLVYVGVQHLLLARDVRGAADWTVVAAIALAAVATQNLAIGFAAGLAVRVVMAVLASLRRTAARRSRSETQST